MARFPNGRRLLRGAALALGAWLLTAAAVPAQGLPKAEEVLDRYIAVTGGKQNYEKFNNQFSRGTMDIAGSGLKGPLSIYHAAPSKMLIQIELEGLGKIEQGTDGKVVWEKNALTGTRVITGAERAALLRRASFHGDINWRKLYKKAEVVAEEKVDGKPAYKVVLTPDEGEPMTQFYDKASGLLVKVTTTVKSPMGDLPTESFVSDYKKVDGLLLPHKVRQTVLVQEVTITLDKIEHNVKIPAERFAIPEDVKKLLDKK